MRGLCARAHTHTHLVFLLGLAAAACGGARGAVSSPSTSALATNEPPPASSGIGPQQVPSDSSFLPASPVPPAPPVPPVRELQSPVPSSMLANLEALGLDSKNLPPIEKLDPRALRGVMKLIAKSLGSRCGDCHREGDFALTTPRKKIAAKMWNEFVAKLVFAANGEPLFCDSCHQGRTRQLDRTDLKALGRWMDANFVAKLKRKDDKNNECETCHVDRENMRFLNKWAGGATF